MGVLLVLWVCAPLPVQDGTAAQQRALEGAEGAAPQRLVGLVLSDSRDGERHLPLRHGDGAVLARRARQYDGAGLRGGVHHGNGGGAAVLRREWHVRRLAGWQRGQLQHCSAKHWGGGGVQPHVQGERRYMHGMATLELLAGRVVRAAGRNIFT